MAANSLPTAEKINELSQKAKIVSESFFSQTFEIRMQYEYSGRFLNQQDKDTLYKSAEKASAELERIANDQNDLKSKIENYQDDDWEARFGQTGLWRKLAADLLDTQNRKLEIDYCLARVVGNLKVEQQFFNTLAKSGLGQCSPLRASIEKIKCLGPSEPNELDDLAKALAKSECKGDPEILLTLAILQSKFAPDALQNTLLRSPKTAAQLGQLILADMSVKFASPDANLASVNPVDAEVAAYSAWTTDPCAHKELLLALCDFDKFKTPLIFYAAGVSAVDSSPEKAIELFIGASALQHQQKDMFLDIEADRIAEQAARLAYDSFTRNNVDCRFAAAAFENYARIASDKMAEQMQYLYGTLLFNCDKVEEAIEVLTRLAERSTTIWRDEASLELIKIKIDTVSSLAIPDDILVQLRNFILNCAGRQEQQNRLRREAMSIYCKILLSRDSSDSAAQVLSLLDAAEPTPGFPNEFFRAQAMQQLGRLEESAHFMSWAVDSNDNSIAPQAVSLLSEVLDKIELWQQDANDFNQMLQNCATLAALAEFANKSANSRQTGLILAEISILQGKRGQVHFPPADENDIDGLRVQARLLMAKGDFEQAALLWAKIAESRRNDTAGLNHKSYGWWQAKFYELDCLANVPQADKQNIRHAIEVLQSSYADIPRPWVEKLDGLREICGN